MKEQSLISEIVQSREDLLRAIGEIRTEDFNKIPFEKSWTPAQVADHVFKSSSGVLETIQGPASASQRDANEKTDAIRDVFLDFTTKLTSPGFVLPGSAPLEKHRITSRLSQTFTGLADAAGSLDLTALITSFELPVFKALTRSEWLWFAVYHTQRHIQQLINIAGVFQQRKQLAK